MIAVMGPVHDRRNGGSVGGLAGVRVRLNIGSVR